MDGSEQREGEADAVEPQGSEPPVEAPTVHDRVTATGIAAPKAARAERKVSDSPPPAPSSDRPPSRSSNPPSRTSRPRISRPPQRDGLGAAAVARPLHELAPIGQFGRFALLGRLAFGGMAEIFLAREENPVTGALRHIVVKRVLPHVADDPSFVQMFLDEARLAIRLQHPNICHIYEFGETEGSFFIAMEWVNGVPLGRLLRRARENGGMSIPVAVRIIAQIAEALHYAHRARDEQGNPIGIVHRDVSLQNIMVSYDGAVKLLDFGVAKAITHSTKTSAGVVKGKLSYMAPEQARGEDVDARADVFALGICLYEALTCRALYHRTTEYETLRAIIDGPVPTARAVEPTIPVVLDEIIQKALQKSPSDRFADAGELQNALEQYLAEERTVVNSGHVGEFVRKLYAEEIAEGPLVDSSPFVLPVGSPSDRPQRASFVPTNAGALAASGGEASHAASSSAANSGRRRWVAVTFVAILAPWFAWFAFLAVRESPTSVTSQGASQGRIEAPAPQPLRNPSVVSRSEETSTEAAAEPQAVALSPEEALDIDWAASTEQESPARPAKAQRPARPQEPATPRPVGRLSLNTRPWSRVFVGGRLLGTTPLGNVDLPPGEVTLRLVDRDGNEHTRRVSVRAGERESVFFDLSAGQ